MRRGERKKTSRRQSLECGAEVTVTFKRFPKAKASNTELEVSLKAMANFFWLHLKNKHMLALICLNRL